MKEYVLTAQARLDFLEAFDFIAANSYSAALRWEARMLKAFDHLSNWPETGFVRLDWAPPPVRFWAERRYIILYDPTASPLRVLAILHDAQDLASLVLNRAEAWEAMQDD